MELIDYLLNCTSFSIKNVRTDVKPSSSFLTEQFFLDDTCIINIMKIGETIDVSINVDENFHLKHQMVYEVRKYFTDFSPERIRFLSGNKKLLLAHNVKDPSFDLYHLFGVEYFDFSIRSYNLLRRNGCRTLGNIIEKYSKIPSFRHMGRKSLNEIEEIVRSYLI